MESLAIVPKTMAEVIDLADRLCKSGLVPKALQNKPADALLIILAGLDVGMSAPAAFRGFHVIEGKVCMGADTMIALVLASGKAAYFDRLEESPTSVTYETHRLGSPRPRRCTWTIEMAKAAAIDRKDNWRLYPRAMLSARAKAELARDVYPDILAGLHTPDELGSEWRSMETPIDAEYVDVPLPPPFTDEETATLDSIDSAATVDDLKVIAAQLSVKGPALDEARKRYSSRMVTLRQAQ
jgi:hypothetical protein